MMKFDNPRHTPTRRAFLAALLVFALLVFALLAAPLQATAAEDGGSEEEASKPVQSKPDQNKPAQSKPAQSKPDQNKPAQSKPQEKVRALDVAVAAVPGFVVHGAGHFVAGDSDTGWKLLGAQLAGAGLLVAGFSGLALTGAADETITPLVGLTALGGASFFFSWFADIYGVSTTADGLGLPEVESAPLDVALGYQYVYNPTFEFGHFLHAGAEARLRRVGLGADGWFAVDAPNWRAQTEASWRFLGPLVDRRGDDGSFVDAEVGLSFHDYGSSDFSELTAEALVRGRLDLHHYAEALRGSFVESAFGLGWSNYLRDEHPDDVSSLLLFDASFGMYLGHGQDGFGEVAIFYDHRHDGFAGGAKLSGLGSGPAGSAGVRLVKSLAAPWGVQASFEAGSAYVGRLDLVYRPGGSR
jgi:hypothetical protein